MVARNCAGIIPRPGPLTEADEALLGSATALLTEIRGAYYEVQAISRALDAIWRITADANRYFAGEQPWSLKKTDPAKMATVLYVTAEVLRQIGILIQPYMPASAAKLLDALAVKPSARSFAALGPGGRLQSDIAIPPPQAIFPRFIDEEIPEFGMIRAVDSHCHLDFKEFSDVGAVVSRAKAAGVELMVTISTRVHDFASTLGIAERFARSSAPSEHIPIMPPMNPM